MQDSSFSARIPSRFFFRITRNGVGTDHSDGLEFSDKSAVWQEAAMTCGEIIRDLAAGIEPGCQWQMEVSDDRGTPVYRFTFTAEEV